MCINGQAPGQIYLPDTLNPGNYLLQASTDFLLNFGPASFFTKKISISQTARSLRAAESRQNAAVNSQMVADVSFLPEGGQLLEGIPNLVAFKAVDKNGWGVNAKGVVTDKSGNEITPFKTDYKGMGIFFFAPEPGKSYFATIADFPEFRFSFDSILVTQGIKIQLVNHTSRELLLNIVANSEKFSGESFFIVNMHRGETLFYQAFKMEGQNHLLKFDSDMLKGGINQLILLDKNLKPVSERLVFSDNLNLNKIKMATDKPEFSHYSEVSLHFQDTTATEDQSNLSVAVVHEAAFELNGVSQNILSALLIDSELNGFIENPADYFSDSEINTRTKQQLLMLTNGWSSYFWNEVPLANEPLKYQQKAGLGLHGIASDVVSGQPVDNGEITLVIEKDGEMAFLTQITDAGGKFAFSGLLFNDTANVYVQAKNERGRQNTSITLLEPVSATPPASEIKALKADFQFIINLEIQKYNHHRYYLEYLRKQGTLFSERETETNEIPGSKDGHFRIYNNADQVIEIPDAEASFGNVLDFLTGKVAGLDINDGNVSIRGTSSAEGNTTPLFLIDGIPVNTRAISALPEEVGQNTGLEIKTGETTAVEKIKAIPLGDIDKVEILKSPQNLALFGTEGANGVIAIYTRKGIAHKPSSTIKGIIEQKIAGYASYKKFYAPKYIPESKNPEKPDFRTTLFWEPEIVLQNNLATHSFFTSGQPGKYYVIVEGISNSGRICTGTTQFEVVEKSGN